MRRTIKDNGGHESQKKNIKCQATYPYLTSEPPVAAPKEMSAIQKLAILYQLVNELRDYIGYVESIQSEEDPIFLDMDAIARKVGMPSKKELYEFLHKIGQTYLI